jgi:hypothetical protein
LYIIKKLGCEVLGTELNPYVNSEAIMARKNQSYAFLEKHQIHAWGPMKPHLLVLLG